jgi:hypothetical protein
MCIREVNGPYLGRDIYYQVRIFFMGFLSLSKQIPDERIKSKTRAVPSTRVSTSLFSTLTKVHGFSPQASYTDRATVNLGFLDPEPLLFHSSNSSVILTRLSGPVPDPLLIRKSGGAGISESVARNSDH